MNDRTIDSLTDSDLYHNGLSINTVIFMQKTVRNNDKNNLWIKNFLGYKNKHHFFLKTNAHQVSYISI